MLPIRTESVEQIRARLPESFAVVYDEAEVERLAAAGLSSRPTLKRRHVFDTPSGVRLIHTRERTADGVVVDKWSGSLRETPTLTVGGSAGAGRSSARTAPAERVLRAVFAAYLEVRDRSRDAGMEVHARISPDLVAHWTEPVEETVPAEAAACTPK